MITKLKNLFKSHIWDTLTILFALSGIILGLIGFQQYPSPESPFLYQLYETIRMFLLNRQFEPAQLNPNILISSWLILLSFILFSSRLFLKILAPKAWERFIIRSRYQNHIVVCGLNELSMSLIEKCKEKQIVVITGNKNNLYLESLRQRNIKIIEGDANDIQVLKLAKIRAATKVYILKANDKTNVEIAYKAYIELSTAKRPSIDPLKCFVLIKDAELKRVLQDSPLFKETGKNAEGISVFDGIPFNIAETGTQYGLIQNIDVVFENYAPDSSPQILIVGLGTEAIHVIKNLAHGLTPKGKELSFTILEDNAEKIQYFENNYQYLYVYAQFKYIPKNLRQSWKIDCLQKESINTFSSIFICYDDKLENLKQAFSFTWKIKQHHPPVILFCDSPESIGDIMCIPDKNNHCFAEANKIHIINTFNETFDYLFELDKNIEECAALTHQKWNKITNTNTPYSDQPEHIKQSNRNQVLDNFYKMYLATGIKLENCRLSPQSFIFSEEQKELMAEMEHRRWCIEKQAYGWIYHRNRDNHLLKHPDLLTWDKLGNEAKEKDKVPVLLMEEYIQSQTDNNN